MVKATRQWGGTSQQGRAFGYLEGGRGLVAALIGAAGVFLLAYFLPDQAQEPMLDDKQNSFQWVIQFTTTLVASVGLLIWFFLKEKTTEDSEITQISSWNQIRTTAKYKAVWYLVIIVICAYCGYKVTDILSLYAADVMGLNDVDAAKIGAFQMYLRPIVCIGIGYIADRTSSRKWLFIAFFVLLLAALIFASGKITPPYTFVFIGMIAFIGFGVYSLRTLYFAAIREGNIPFALTGTAVGIISVVGYTPDIFMGPVMGYLLDEYPGINGHQNVFLLLSGFALVGTITAYLFSRSTSIKH